MPLYPLVRQSLSQGAGGSMVDDPDIRANEYLDVSRTVGSDLGYRARVSIARAMAQGFASPHAMAMHPNLDLAGTDQARVATAGPLPGLPGDHRRHGGL